MAGGLARRRRLLVGVPLVLALARPGAASVAGDASAVLWVDRSSSNCSDAYSRQRALAPETPWCSVVRAAQAATAGDTVRIRPGTYVGSVRPLASGTPEAPVRYVADPADVVVDAGGASAAVKLVGITDVALEGVTVTGAAVQGIWAYQSQRLVLDRLTVRANGGAGIQLRDSTAVTVSRSVITGNGGAGIFETDTSAGGRYVGNAVTGNGIDGAPYNGDGLQLGGAGAHVAGNTITGNGDPGPYEHGVYAGPSARDAVIEGNTVSGNAGSNIKAAGSGVVVRYNRLEGGRLGLVVSDNATPVSAYYNLILGPYQHGVLVTTDRAPARARLWNNTIVVGARAGAGDGSAVFVKAAASLELRNNVMSYADPDNAGSALYVVDAKQVGAFTSDANWFSSTDPNGRHLTWNGARLTLAKWRRNGHDGRSIGSTPPRLDVDAHVVSTNLGRARGEVLGLTRDYAGTAVPAGAAPDIGAYQAV